MATQAAVLPQTKNSQLVAFPADAVHTFGRGNGFVTMSDRASEASMQEFYDAVAALKELGIQCNVRGRQVTIFLRAQS